MIRWRRSDPIVEQVRAVTSALAIPHPWNRTAFLEHIAALVGKPIRLMPLPASLTAGLPCGLVLDRVEDIMIAYDTHSSGYHADHIVLHEIGHLLLDHADDKSADTRQAAVGTLFPGIDPNTVVRVLERSDYDATAERQAELFASLVMSASRAEPRGSLLRHAMFPD
ncbi:hypothetical protein [Nocardia nepalensis]|uniref:hypothetical protein n=1 Tax=Nocardia nepalensis TaxID=3375448 RepID=UPI003B66EF86